MNRKNDKRTVGKLYVIFAIGFSLACCGLGCFLVGELFFGVLLSICGFAVSGISADILRI